MLRRTERLVLALLGVCVTVGQAFATPPAHPAPPALFASTARPAPPAFPAHPALPSPQVPFEAAIRDLSSPDSDVRLKNARILKDAAYLEAAIPLARLVVDPADDVQIEAIAAELNIFLVERIVTRKRVGLLIEKRQPVDAEALFTDGPLVVGPSPVPVEVLNALRTAARDDNPRIRLEAVYAFGVLGVEARGERRRELLRVSGPDLAAMIGAVDVAHRYAALRVIGRLFTRRPEDAPIDPSVGDAVVHALNEPEAPMRMVAMQALGEMRYDRASQSLMDLFRYYGKGDMAAATLDAAARIGHPSIVPDLVSQLGSSNAPMRGIAIEGLARAGDRTKLVNIQTALQGERTESLWLAGSFAALMLSTDDTDLLAPIVSALSKPRLREQALGYLIEAAPGRAQAFGRHVQSSDAAVRADLIDALGLGGDRTALAAVDPLSADPDAAVARAAARAVARLRQMRGAGA